MFSFSFLLRKNGVMVKDVSNGVRGSERASWREKGVKDRGKRLP
jgi:hypothetical protein